ncbi:MAG: alternate F1F0 ATPase, F1 subunit alpha [Parachlamydiaceae bacterium]|nr:alternate F1F0 ATPase, F1 subunit alpha [Parachlamydiaceae bacterium]
MPSQDQDLRSVLTSVIDKIDQVQQTHTAEISIREVGIVTAVLNGIAKVSGLPHVGFEELLQFPGGYTGLAFDLDEEEVGVVLLEDSPLLKAGMEVERTGRVVDIPVGDGLLGRVVNAQAQPLDGLGSISFSERLPIEREAPRIVDRAPVTIPLQTGIKVIDALIPIGHGQRELILGDRQTGKTAIAIDAIINQKGKDVICVYCAIGQRSSSVAKVISELREHGAMDYTVVMVAEGNESPGLRYIAPYAATSIAEYFMYKGHKVLIVYDDLTNHARAYRELSLLMRRPPGREAFPGDIFYIHAKLLERATHLNDKLGGGALTALPIIETEAQDISAYIPTNLISITDGQILLSQDLFEKGNLPAVDVGKSVSRVGGKAQLPAYREVTGTLKLSYAQFEELEAFAKFGTQLDVETRKILDHGRRIRWCLNQNRLDPFDVHIQIFTLLAFSEGLLDSIPLNRLSEAEKKLRSVAAEMSAPVRQQILEAEKMNIETRNMMLNLAKEALSKLLEEKHE